MEPSDSDDTPFAWDELVDAVKDGRVVPIVGRELYRMDDGSTLDGAVAAQLAAELGLDPRQPLPEIAFRYAQAKGARVYARVNQALQKASVIPEAIARLARVPTFRLFVSTTADSLLERALDDARFGGRKTTASLAFSPLKAVEDLPSTLMAAQPIVFHLLGRASSFPDFVVTEEDLIEFLQALQLPGKRPDRLFDELRTNHLLFLGCGYQDWLARFFIRTLNGKRFKESRDRTELIADATAGQQRELVLFLTNYGSTVFHGNAVDFVNELSRRLEGVTPAPMPKTRPAPERAVFLSYAHEDVGFVSGLQRVLSEAGIPVWFDERRLEAGVQIDPMIAEAIRRCALFVPVLSQTTAAAREGYFRREWMLAIARAQGIDPSYPFICPVAADALRPGAPGIPQEFNGIPWLPLDAGNVGPRLVEALKLALAKVSPA